MESPGTTCRKAAGRLIAAAVFPALLALAAGSVPARAQGAHPGASVGAAPRAPTAGEEAGPAAAVPAPASVPGKPRGGVDPVAEKFRKLQAEMSGGSAASAPRESAPPAPVEPVGLLPLSLKVLLGLAFVILLAVACIRGLKRLQGRLLSRPGSVSGGNLIEVLETCHLGPQQRVVALRINDEVGIVGVTQHGISLLTTLAQPAGEVRKLMAGSGNPAAFSESLNKLLDRFKKPKRVSDLLDEQT